MAPRGIGKKQKKKAVYRGFPQGFTLNQGSPSDARSTGKDPIEDDSSDSGPENEPANSKHLSLPNVAQPKNMPKCPTPDRMFNWRIGDYERYDDYLITKWNLFGFSDNETTYMSIKAQDSRLARCYRSIWSKLNKKKY